VATKKSDVWRRAENISGGRGNEGVERFDIITHAETKRNVVSGGGSYQGLKNTVYIEVISYSDIFSKWLDEARDTDS
jgi:hypothetical protein